MDAMSLRDTIKYDNKAFSQNKEKTMIFLRHHPNEVLEIKYLIIKDLIFLWQNLKERYDHQRIIILLKARYDWIYL
jgi:hypothetical protein